MTNDPEITDPRDPYKRPDIVAELDRWLRVYHFAGLIDVAVIQRARDEIVALREKASRLERGLLDEWGTTLIAKARAEALEKAARLCERVPGDPKHGDFFATAIRALKGEGHG